MPCRLHDMMRREWTAPFTFFALVLPYGISSGFNSITLPYILTREGFSVAAAGAMVALGVSANLWRFLWGPVADLTLTARRWYYIGIATSAGTLAFLAVAPVHGDAGKWLGAVVFLSQVAATFIVLPVGGLMAHTVAEEAKGRAAGWYQAGNLGGTGIGGGAGVWLASHYSRGTAGSLLALAMIACAAAIHFVPDVRIVSNETVGQRIQLMGRDLKSMLRATIPLFTIALVMSPVGSGAMNNLWSAVADDWKASADRVALVTGLLNGIVSAVGCILGGWVADRIGRWWAYFGSGIALTIVTSVMAIAPRDPLAYSIGVLAYALFCGMAYAAFSAVVLFAIGRGVASTKYALLSSLGNIPVVYMTAANGWMHDRFSSAWMLQGEALAGVVAIAVALGVLERIRRRNM